MKLLPWTPASISNPDPRKAKITVADLLSGRSGLACDDRDSASPGREGQLYEAADWAKATLDVPQAADPGTTAKYCTGGIFLAERIIETQSRTGLLAFAR